MSHLQMLHYLQLSTSTLCDFDFKDQFCIYFFRPWTFLDCFALELSVFKIKQLRNVLGRKPRYKTPSLILCNSFETTCNFLMHHRGMTCACHKNSIDFRVSTFITYFPRSNKLEVNGNFNQLCTETWEILDNTYLYFFNYTKL